MWIIPSLTVKSPECRDLDFRILHNAIFTKVRLLKIGMVNTAQCDVCNSAQKDLMHLFTSCSSISSFANYFAEKLEILFQFAPVSYLNGIDYTILLLFGYSGKHSKINDTFVNFLCSSARYILKCRNLYMYHNKSVEVLELFKFYCVKSIKQRRAYYKEKGNQAKFCRDFLNLNPLVLLSNNGALVIRL